MSGGPYGRGKAPERACLKVDQWPEPDRRLWLAACAPGDILDDEVGARSDRAAISNAKAATGYGRWLTFLATSPQKCGPVIGQRATSRTCGFRMNWSISGSH